MANRKKDAAALPTCNEVPVKFIFPTQSSNFMAKEKLPSDSDSANKYHWSRLRRCDASLGGANEAD
ncbi:polyubiquitin [Anopheles sinensis]|uniref:Polyubiquitin n=1 Tax=Anopheles sinensis TaxID=74873 RepID=A0A084WBH9_ANOSI|nr:polyubiquitin [Anopheles sinensis]